MSDQIDSYQDSYPLPLTDEGYCGSALIFVMNEFLKGKPRNGALKECENLKTFAKQLHLKPHVFLNATEKKIRDTLTHVGNAPKKHYPKIADDIWDARVQPTHGAIMVAIVSHGNSTRFLTSDGNHFPDRDIDYYLNEENCHLLGGKPKFIFFNKCRTDNGDEFEQYFAPSELTVGETESENPQRLAKDGMGGENKTKNLNSSTNSNFVHVYSCTEGTSSLRHSGTGSFVLSALPDAYARYGKGRDICRFFRRFRHEMLGEINRKLQEVEEYKDYTQCISTEKETLTRDLIFPYFTSSVEGNENLEEMEVEETQGKNGNARNFAVDDSQNIPHYRLPLQEKDERKPKIPKKSLFPHRICKYKKAQHTFRPGGPRIRRTFFSFFNKNN